MRPYNNLISPSLRSGEIRGGKRLTAFCPRAARAEIKAVKTDCPLRGLPLTAAIGIFQLRYSSEQGRSTF